MESPDKKPKKKKDAPKSTASSHNAYWKGHCVHVDCMLALAYKRIDKVNHAKAFHGGDTTYFIRCEEPCEKCAMYQQGSSGGKWKTWFELSKWLRT